VSEIRLQSERNMHYACHHHPRAAWNEELVAGLFAAADAIKEDKRPAAIKAALASIRGELKASRERAKLAKSRAGKRGPGRPRKVKTV
jgi:hypothetical protein